MATTNYSWNLPVVGGSENTWGTQLNANWTALDTLLNGVTQAEISLLKNQTSLVPSGVIVMWSGSVATIPSGWYICDGTNGTPDLTGRFVVHADADSGGTYAPGDTGGSDDVTLTEAQMPAHTHTVSGTTNTTGAHRHFLASDQQVTRGANGASDITDSNQIAKTTTGDGSDWAYALRASSLDATLGRSSSEGDHSHTFSGTTSSTGGGTAHENRPPYYALAYIMKA